MRTSITNATATLTLTVAMATAMLSLSIAPTRAADDATKDGKKDARTAPATTTTTADQPGPARFYGTITAVDVNAKTFTVDKQTYTIVAESQVTKADDDKPATVADAVIGEPARGSYTKSSDGTLNVTKVRFGKKTGGGGKAAGKKNNKDAAATKPAAKE